MTTLSKLDDQFVRRAASVVSPVYQEVGFYPNDQHGCKIYARLDHGVINIVVFHSQVYGCQEFSAYKRLPELELAANQYRNKNLLD